MTRWRRAPWVAWEPLEAPGRPSEALVSHERSRRYRWQGHILGPEQPQWSPDEDTVEVTSARRLPDDDPALVALPAPAEIATAPFGATVAARRAERSYLGRPVSLADVAALLHLADGTTGAVATASGMAARRAAPSGGARYPREVYLVALDVEGLAPGVYHYRPEPHLLEPVQEGEARAALSEALLFEPAVAGAAGALIVSGVWHRTMVKYGERGYRNALVEAGAVMEQAWLAAVALGLGAVALDFVDADVDRLIDVDGVSEASLVVLLFGQVGSDRV